MQHKRPLLSVAYQLCSEILGCVKRFCVAEFVWKHIKRFYILDPVGAEQKRMFQMQNRSWRAKIQLKLVHLCGVHNAITLNKCSTHHISCHMTDFWFE